MDYSLSDFAAIHHLTTLVDTSLDEIGRKFTEVGNAMVHMGPRAATSIGLSLVTCYRECGEDGVGQASRLTLLYLIYRTRDLRNGITICRNDRLNTPCHHDIDTHRFLPFFLRLLTEHRRHSAAASSSHFADMHFCTLPSATQKEAFLLELFVAASAEDLKEASLFKLTSSQLLAMELDVNTAGHPIDLEERLKVADQLLLPRCLLSSGRENHGAGALGLPTGGEPETDLIIKSLIPPAFFYALAAQPLAPFTPDELPLIYPSLVGPWGEEESVPPDTIRVKTPDGDPTSLLPPREFAIDFLRRTATGHGSSQLSRSDTTKVQQMLLSDPSIFDDVDLKDHFHKLVRDQPDIAAELLLYELLRQDEEESMNLHFEILLSSELNVQTLLVFNRFISGCENRELTIPDAFLEKIISHCISACEESTEANQIMMHRLVRMVCVFFTTLVRLRNFNIRPRLAELQSFAARFSSLREASNLYQATLQLK